MAQFKQKFYKIFNIRDTDNLDDMERVIIEPQLPYGNLFDSKKEAEEAIQGYGGSYNLLTILEVWV